MGSTTKTHKFSGGVLIANPSDFSSPETLCGGTQLGTAQSLSLTITEKVDPITAEEWGSVMIDGIVLGEEAILSGSFTGWDEDLVANVFYGGAVGAASTPTLLSPEAHVGKLAESAKSPSLLWLPKNDTRDPAFYAYNAIPWRIPKPVYFSGRKPMVVFASWILVRGSSNATYKSALLADL